MKTKEDYIIYNVKKHIWERGDFHIFIIFVQGYSSSQFFLYVFAYMIH